MAEQIGWMFKIQATSGPTITASDTIRLETYVKSSVTVSKDHPVTVAFVASPSVLAVISSTYTDGTDYVTYQINGAGAAIKLDGPLVFVGAENVKRVAD